MRQLTVAPISIEFYGTPVDQRKKDELARADEPAPARPALWIRAD
jgi:hypothetical protein